VRLELHGDGVAAETALAALDWLAPRTASTRQLVRLDRTLSSPRKRSRIKARKRILILSRDALCVVRSATAMRTGFIEPPGLMMKNVIVTSLPETTHLHSYKHSVPTDYLMPSKRREPGVGWSVVLRTLWNGYQALVQKLQARRQQLDVE
jgi:hypothetical protein